MTTPNTESRGSRADTPGRQDLSRTNVLGESTGEGRGAREQIREVKNQVVDQAKNTFNQARERASSSLGESKGQFADQFSSIAGALRRTTEHLRAEDQERIAGLTETVARQVDEVANYLRNKDARAMRRDVEDLARRQPALAIGGALVLGLIGARFFRSTERRRETRRLADGRTYGRERRYGYTGYNQPYFGETETERHFDVGRSGGEYAGA